MTGALESPCTELAYARLSGAVRVILSYPDVDSYVLLKILRRAYADAGVIARGLSDVRVMDYSYGRHHNTLTTLECHDPPTLRLANSG